jgi:predicted amidophosphoribosyltransferase
MICTHCFEDLKPDANFCKRCGQPCRHPAPARESSNTAWNVLLVLAVVATFIIAAVTFLTARS